MNKEENGKFEPIIVFVGTPIASSKIIVSSSIYIYK
jgi:hypothetical protein